MSPCVDWCLVDVACVLVPDEPLDELLLEDVGTGRAAQVSG
jgi:hypothetical protein